MDVELLCRCLRKCGKTGRAVAVLSGIGGNGVSVLQDLNVEVSPLGVRRGLIPDPEKVSAVVILIPDFVVGFQKDRGGVLQCLFGKGGGLFAPFLKTSRGLGRVDGQNLALTTPSGKSADSST